MEDDQGHQHRQMWRRLLAPFRFSDGPAFYVMLRLTAMLHSRRVGGSDGV